MADTAQENNNNACSSTTPQCDTPCCKSDTLKDITNSTSSQNTNQASKFHSLYDTKEEIGRGMSSVVRRCIHRSTGKEYAVKIIDLCKEEDDLEHHKDTDLRSVTRNEIRILQELKGHANIIELIETFEISSSIFLVFELLQKGELFDYLTEVVKCSERQTRKFMRSILQGLKFIHEKNIVHRDLKPENILLDSNLNVHLSDFGFSHKLVPSNELLTELLGTPVYMAPEMLKCSMTQDHRGYGTQIDLWAAGVIMYSLLAGKPPFWHRRQIVMLRRIVEGRYSLLEEEWSDNCKDLVSKLLVVDPCERLTAEQALSHPFFDVEGHNLEGSKVETVRKGLRRFRIAGLVVLAVRVIDRKYQKMMKLPTCVAAGDPYSIKRIRKQIDNCAFNIYGHWVKKAGDQNRAVLFENNIEYNEQHDNENSDEEVF